MVDDLFNFIVEAAVKDNVTKLLTFPGFIATYLLEPNFLTSLVFFMWYLATEHCFYRLVDHFGFSESTACQMVGLIINMVHDNMLTKIMTWPNIAKHELSRRL